MRGTPGRRHLLPLALLVTTIGIAHADPIAQFKQIRQPHADVPFRMELQVEGFDEAPPPLQPKLEIAGADVAPIAVQPNVMRSIQIVNGRRQDEVHVTWTLAWRVVSHSAGSLHIPNVTVKQGSKSATARGGDITVDTIPTSDDMKLELALPTRPVFLGETVPVKLSWLFRAQPEDQTFTIPLASLDTFTVSAPPMPPNARQRPIVIAAGSKDLEVPYEVDKATVGGLEYTRLSLTLFVAPRTIPPGGKLDIPPASVVAALQVGRRDFFGNANTRMFRAVDNPHTLEVKALPETDRPPSFAGAVGEQFSIDVRTSRSVVTLGEPVELEVTVKADQRLDTFSLGKLDGPGRLPKDKFTAPAESPTGELSDDGRAKTFKVVAQVTGPATEIPALELSYFDPRKQAYQTIKSQPIALSVKGGNIVGANDVVIGKRTGAKSTLSPGEDNATLVNADLALSTGDGGSPLGGSLLWILVGVLYALPIGILGFRSWQLRTAESREEAGEVRAARKTVEGLLDKAATEPAREIAGPLVAALRDFARVLGRPVDDRGLLGKIETEAFAPEAANQPLSPDLRSDAAGLLRRWTGEERRARGAASVAKNVAVIALLAVFVPDARADSLSDGRAAYQYAMELTGDATGRKAAFSRAATALGDAARGMDNPELLADWGNAALGAGEVASATLAYRRALLLDPGNARARHNLGWLRGRLPDRMQPITAAGASDTLLFFHRWPRSKRLLVGAGAFALAILLLVPWSKRRRGGTALLAIIPAAIWVAMLASVVLENRHTEDGVVMDAVVLRAADSAGAPAALTEPVPRGVEVTILERRDSWTRVSLPNGPAGWLPDGAVERIVK